MKAYLIDTHLVPKGKVICKGQGQISGSCFSKDGCFTNTSGSVRINILSANAFSFGKYIKQRVHVHITCNIT